MMDNPIIDSIRQIQEQGRTGSLPLQKGAQTIVLTFRDGLIDAAGSNIADLRLGNIFSRKGLIKTAAIPRLLEKARRRRMILGRAVAHHKLADDDDVRDSVLDQIVATLAYALANDFSAGAFDESPIDLYAPARVDIDSLILEMARRNLSPVNLDPNRALCLNNGHSLSHFPWYPQEVSVLSLLKTPRTLQDLAAHTGMEHEHLNKILGVFQSLNLLRHAEGAPAAASDKPEKNSFEQLIPEIGRGRLSSKLETFHNPSSFISEQFKSLKVKLAEAATQAPLRVIAVSSPHTEDGKSLVSANLAVSLAKDAGRRVAVVDCDLRNPSLHKFLGASMDPGLLGYLEGGNLQPYCYMRRLEKLYVMTAGGVSEKSVELLSTPRMQDLVAELKADFDTVILDCPPFGPISDAQILTGLADGFLVIVRCGKTTYGNIEKAFQSLDRSKLVGLIFNDVKPMLFNTRYHYKYYHYRSYYPYGGAKPTTRRKRYFE
jgi:capsular exopolysaccharide synthesis family protein